MSVIYENPAFGLPFTPHSAVRKGVYRLIFDWNRRLNLYNLRKDISEKNNLATQMPDKTHELFAELINFLEKNEEKKYWASANSDYDPKTEVRKVPYNDLYRILSYGEDIISGKLWLMF
ncbi:MAG: hypothetical protein Q8P34_19125 [Bacteroidota bacterium]|nr:hypothetical protein [Bacteroidota bacterium]